MDKTEMKWMPTRAAYHLDEEGRPAAHRAGGHQQRASAVGERDHIRILASRGSAAANRQRSRSHEK